MLSERPYGPLYALIGHLLLPPLHRRVEGQFNGADLKRTKSASSSLY
jgi:hypothetical protein